MDQTTWEKLLVAAGDDYELCFYDRENMMFDTSVRHLIFYESYRAAIERWMSRD